MRVGRELAQLLGERLGAPLQSGCGRNQPAQPRSTVCALAALRPVQTRIDIAPLQLFGQLLSLCTGVPCGALYLCPPPPMYIPTPATQVWP